MIKELGSRVISVSQIKIPEEIPTDILKTLMLRPPLLRNSRLLTDEAIKLTLLQTPPIVYEKSEADGKKHYMCVANFRSLDLAKRLTDSTKIGVNIIAPPLNSHIGTLSLLLNFSCDIATAVDPEKASQYLSELRDHIKKHVPQSIEAVSPNFKYKKSFLEALGIDRRKKLFKQGL